MSLCLSTDIIPCLLGCSWDPLRPAPSLCGAPKTCPICVWGPQDLPHRVWGLLIPAPSLCGAPPRDLPHPCVGPLRPAPSACGVLRPAASLCGGPQDLPHPCVGPPRPVCHTPDAENPSCPQGPSICVLWSVLEFCCLGVHHDRLIQELADLFCQESGSTLRPRGPCCLC